MERLFFPETLLFMFYLVCLLRWNLVKRPLFYLLGVAGLLFGLIAGFFGNGENAAVVARIFVAISNIVAFAAAVGACFGGELPMKLPGNLGQAQTPPPAAPK